MNVLDQSSTIHLLFPRTYLEIYMKKIFENGPFLIIIAAILWALDGIIRRSLYVLPPITIVFFEHLIGLVILTPFLLKDLKGFKIKSKEFLAITLVSLLSSVLGTLWFTTALLKVNFISFSVVFLIQKLQPIFAIFFAKILLKEKTTKKYYIWAGLAVVAAFFVTFKNGAVNFKTGSGTIEAALYALGAAFAWGSSTAFSRYALINNKDKVVTGLRFAMGTVISLIFVYILNAQSSLVTINFSQALRFIVIALSTGMVGLLIYYKGLKKTEVKVSTILELTFPVLAIFIDMFLYKTFLSPTQLIAAAALFIYMYKVVQSTRVK